MQIDDVGNANIGDHHDYHFATLSTSPDHLLVSV